jgi:hypothetical protein
MKSKLNCVLVIDEDEPTNFFKQAITEEAGSEGFFYNSKSL